MSEEKDLLDKIVAEVKAEDDAKTAAPKATEETVTEEAAETPAPEVKEAAAPKAVITGDNMEELMEQDTDEVLIVGQPITGKIIDIDGSVVLVDLGRIGTGMVIGREAKSGLSADAKLAVGSEIEAVVTDLYNEDSYIELSIREASYEKAWDDLRDKVKEETTVKTKILEANKGGLIVEMNGITGFLPVSQLSSKNYPRVEDGDKNKILEILKALIGKELGVRILDANQVEEKLIVSEKAAHSDEERKAITGLTAGHIVDGEISGVVDFGCFVKFEIGEGDGAAELEGLVHISELAWQMIDNPRDLYKIGDKVQAKIIGIDDTRISLSVKSLLNDPWTNIEKKYKVGEIYTGKVDKINPFGAFVYLDSDIHGLAHVSEFQEAYKGKKLDETVEAGTEYEWKVLSIDAKAHRMGLILADGKTVAAGETKKAPKAEEKPAEEVKEAKEETKEESTE